MEREEIEAQIRSLTETEAKILYLKCSGLDYLHIGSQFHFGEKWVQVRASEMYRKLDFPKEMSPKERNKVLQEKYCKVLTEMWDNQHPWPPDDPNPDPPASWLMVVQEEYKFEEEERGIVPHPPNKILVISPTNDDDHGGDIFPRHRPWSLYAIITILLIALVYFISKGSLPLQPLPTQTPLPTYTLFPTFTVPAVVVVPANTIEPTSIVNQSPTTPAPSLTPRPTQDILLETNFMDNKLDGWNIQGKYTIINGSITWQGQSPFTISAGDSSWKNYELQVSFTRLDTGSCDVSIGVRVNDNGDLMAVKTVRAGRLGWWSLKNGKWDWIAQNEYLVGNPPLIIDIKVQGNLFNWVGATSMTMDGFDSGGISISTTCDAMDYIKVIKLP